MLRTNTRGQEVEAAGDAGPNTSEKQLFVDGCVKSIFPKDDAENTAPRSRLDVLLFD